MQGTSRRKEKERGEDGEKNYAEQRRKLVIEFAGRKNVVSRAPLYPDNQPGICYAPWNAFERMKLLSND